MREEEKVTETDRLVEERRRNRHTDTFLSLTASWRRKDGINGFLAPNLLLIPLFLLVPGPGWDSNPQLYT